MFFEEIKQIILTLREAVNLFLSRIFNKGVPITEDMTTLILIGFAIFIILLCLFVWYRQHIRSLKSKAPEELSVGEKEKRLVQLEKEHAKTLELQIKEEKKLREEKESAKLAKAEQREKDLQEKIASIEEERLNQQVLQREIEKTAETVKTPDEVTQREWASVLLLF